MLYSSMEMGRGGAGGGQICAVPTHEPLGGKGVNRFVNLPESQSKLLG